MDGNHFHVGVRDLDATLDWFARVLETRSTFRGERMAVLPFGPILLVVDQSNDETVTTIGYGSVDCDEDFRTLTARGAVAIEEPKDRSWGTRVAYLEGPGRLTLEIEQPIGARGGPGGP
jgi:catechol 2,3-dioxygenase-like lactoylglutathione lyase family enzyme